MQINRGFRVEMCSAIGPYKGGLRFHPTVYLGMLKFLAFEQVFKNALTTLPLGAGKGGADFDPKGRSEGEVMRFCQSFMTELQRHIGQFTDVPAGDIGVGAREIGYLFGQYRRIRNEFAGVITGKGMTYGGSLIRPEATGYGAVYFAREMLATRDDGLEGKRCVVSGAGNVAQYTVEKLLELGAVPVTLSDSGGFVYDKDGIDLEKLAYVEDLKNVRRGRIMEYAERYPHAMFTPVDPAKHYNPLWVVEADCAFPSATQNEINGDDAANLLAAGVTVVSEGANMPTVPDGVERFVRAGILYGPGKAANAGGVAVSGLEMSQNSGRETWRREDVDRRLQEIMRDIHEHCRVDRGGLRRAGELRARREHHRLHEGGRRDARAGRGVAAEAQSSRSPGSCRARKSRITRCWRTSSSVSFDPWPVVYRYTSWGAPRRFELLHVRERLAERAP